MSYKGSRFKNAKAQIVVFCKERIHFLGHIISKDGVEFDPDKVATVANMNPPSNLKALRAILGSVGFYRRIIADFGRIAVPLYRLLIKTDKFVCTTECCESMNHFKLKLQEEPKLCFPKVVVQFQGNRRNAGQVD